MSKIQRILQKIYAMYTRANLITPLNLESQIQKNGFPIGLQQRILHIFTKKIQKEGLQPFQKELSHLHFHLPKQLTDPDLLEDFYNEFPYWFENELRMLEKEIGLSWKEQSIDLVEEKEVIRKSQLVLRDRLQWVIMDILDRG